MRSGNLILSFSMRFLESTIYIHIIKGFFAFIPELNEKQNKINTGKRFELFKNERKLYMTTKF